MSHSKACSVFHSPSSINKTCNQIMLSSATQAFAKTLQQNAPVYTLINLASYGVTREFFLKSMMSTVRSSVFYALSVGLYTFLRCTLSEKLGPGLTVFLPAWLSFGLGTLVEDPAQVTSILIFQGKDTLYTLGNLAVAKGIVPNSPVKATVLVFSLALGFLNYFYRTDPDRVPGIPQLLMNFFFQKKSKPDQLEQLILEQLEKQNPPVDDEEEEEEEEHGKEDEKDWTKNEILVGFSKNFSTGFLLQCGYIISDALYNRKIPLPVSLLRDSILCGSFLGGLALTNRALSTLFNRLTNRRYKSSKLLPFCSAFFSGLSMFFMPSPFLASFTLSNALYSISSAIVKKYPILPSRIITSVFYGLSTAISLYALHFENYAVSAFWKNGLLFNLAGGESPSIYSGVIAK